MLCHYYITFKNVFNTVSKTTNTYVNNKLDTHIDSYTDTTVKYTYDDSGELQQVTEKLGNTLICQVMEWKEDCYFIGGMVDIL